MTAQVYWKVLEKSLRQKIGQILFLVNFIHLNRILQEEKKSINQYTSQQIIQNNKKCYLKILF